MPSTLVESSKVASRIVRSSTLVPLSSSSHNLIAAVVELLPTASSAFEDKTTGQTMQEHTSLTLEEYRRYGRQMILRGFGLPGKSTVSQITYRASQAKF
jgi:hypothetical protein